MNDPRSPGDAETISPYTADTCSDPFDLVAEEFVERCRRGDSPSISEYEQRFPEHAGKIRELLPSVAMMEQLKRARPIVEKFGVRVVRIPPRPAGRVPHPPRAGPRRAWGSSTRRSRNRSDGTSRSKVIPRHGVLDAKRRQRFQREAQAVAKLHHTNIVPIFAVGEHEGLPYYAMQYIRGDGLDQAPGDLATGRVATGPRHTGDSSPGSAFRPRMPPVCPRTGHPAPRHQAGQPPDRRAPGRVDHGLRPGEAGRARRPDRIRATSSARCVISPPRRSGARPITGATSTAWA